MPEAITELPVEGVLHLAALSVGLLVAYVGIDRIHPPDDRLQGEISRAKDAVSVLLKRFDAIRDDGSVVFVYEIYALFVLCHVAGQKIKMNPIKRAWNFVRFQLHVPLLPYFRNRFDMKVVSAMAAFSLILFLLLTAATIWAVEFVHSRWFLHFCFYWFVFSMTFIFFTVLASSKLIRIGGTCGEMEGKINARLKEMMNLAAAASTPSTVATPEH